MTYDDFINIFPEFANLVSYPIARVDFWLDFSKDFVNSARWGTKTNYGICLLTAHQLFMDSRNGQTKGVIKNKSVDSVSYSADVNLTTMKKAGYYNNSSYGVQYWQLSQLFGAGPISV